MKKKNSNHRVKNKNNIIILIILLITCLFFIVCCITVKKSSFYKIVDRTENIKKYKKKESYTIVGWLKVQGTNIDYPVLFSDDSPIDDINTNFGWTYRNVDKLDDRTVIEGHNILNLSANPKIADSSSKRFEQLLSFYDINFSKNNKYIQYTLNEKNYIFKIFAVGFPEIETYYMQDTYSKSELNEYIENSKKNSLFDYDVEVNDSDKLISLYTCTRFFGYDKAVVFRVDGRLLRKNERIVNYELKANKNYREARKVSELKKTIQEVS